MNFTLKQTPYYSYNMDELIKDYENMELSVNEIKEKYNIGSGAWQTVLKRLKEHGVTMRGYSKTQPVRKAKHYYFDRSIKAYRVHKYIGDDHYLFGSYKTEKEAQSRVEELKENNWEGLIDD